MSALLDFGVPSRGVLAAIVLGAASLAAATATAGEYRFSPVIVSSDPVPGVAGDSFRLLRPWTINRQGDVAFDASLNSGRRAVFRTHGGQVEKIVLSGEAAPGGGTIGYGSIGHVTINDHGDLGFVHYLAPYTAPDGANSGVYKYSSQSGTLAAFLVPYVTPSPAGEPFIGGALHGHLNNRGGMAFGGIFPIAPGTGISGDLGTGVFYRDPQGTVHNVASPGDPAPGGRVFNFAINPSLNDHADVAFAGHLAEEECIDFGIPQTVWIDCGTSVYLRRRSGEILSIAHQGEPAAGGGTYRLAYGPLVNNHGDVVFVGDLTAAPGYGNDLAMFVYRNAAVVPIARPGDAMPGGGTLVQATNFGLGNYGINDRGDVAFNATLDTRTNGEPDTGLYVWRRGHLRLVARSGTVLPGLGTVASVLYNAANGAAINDRGQVLFLATLTDGRNAVLLAARDRFDD